MIIKLLFFTNFRQRKIIKEQKWKKEKNLEGHFSCTTQGINNQLDLVQCGQSCSIVIWGAVRISLKCEINKGQTECDRNVGRIEMKQKGKDRREAETCACVRCGDRLEGSGRFGTRTEITEPYLGEVWKEDAMTFPYSQHSQHQIHREKDLIV